MSWKDEEIDALFNNASAPEAPPYEERFWTEMEAMLPQERRRKSVFWWFAGAAVTVLGISLVMILLQEDATMPAVEKTGVQQETPIKTAPSETPELVHVVAQTQTNTTGSSQRAIYSEMSAAEASPATQQTVTLIENEAEIIHQTAEVTGNLPLKELILLQRTVVDNHSKIKEVKGERFYLQFGVGAGQSAMRSVPDHSSFLHYYAFGGGLFRQLDHMVLSYGAQVRMDVAQNVIFTTASGNGTKETNCQQLFSVETPLSIGYQTGRNTFALNVIPGFQTNFSGKYTEYQDNIAVRSERVSGKVVQAKTLTMEVGVSYLRTLQPHWYLGASVGADAIRPYSPEIYKGESRLLPLNGQLLLRRTF